jgi:hypothetical protein
MVRLRSPAATATSCDPACGWPLIRADRGPPPPPALPPLNPSTRATIGRPPPRADGTAYLTILCTSGASAEYEKNLKCGLFSLWHATQIFSSGFRFIAAGSPCM